MSVRYGELPQGWEPVKVGDIVELKYGKSLPAKKRDNAGYPVFGSNGAVGAHSVPNIQGPALIVGRKGSIGEVHQCNGPCSPIDTTYFVDEFYEQPIRFWYHRLKALPLAELNRATALPGLNRGDAYDLEITLPPLAEQRRIVAKIESLQERSARAREALADVGPLLEQFRQSVLRAAFSGQLTADWREQNPDVEPASELLTHIRTERRQRWEQSELAKYGAKGKKPPKNWQDKYKEPEPLSESESAQLPEIPDNWVWAAVEELVEPGIDIVYGIVQPGPNLDEGVPYVRGLDIQDGVILVDQLWKTSPKIAERYNRSALDGGDVLLGIIRHTKVAVVPDVLSGGNMGRATARFRPSSVITPQFLAGTLEAPQTQSWLLGESRGIDMPIINVGDVRRTPIALAPFNEQSVITELVDQWIESFAGIRTAHEESGSALTQLDQSILAKAFRGELVPQNPNDEPATTLLERIRTQREAEAAKKKTKPKKKRKTKA